MTDKLKEFRDFREKMNERIMGADNLAIKRFFNLDNTVYEEGKLSRKTKEMLGLVASLVLRCDDCISHHIIRCREEGLAEEEFYEVFSIALMVGGSIVIPHVRRGVKLLEELKKE